MRLPTRGRRVNNVNNPPRLAKPPHQTDHFAFDGRYGAPTDAWTKEMFIETVYAELAGSKQKK